MSGQEGSYRARYRCNCGQEFPTHFERMIHALTCPTMTAGKGADDA